MEKRHNTKIVRNASVRKCARVSARTAALRVCVLCTYGERSEASLLCVQHFDSLIVQCVYACSCIKSVLAEEDRASFARILLAIVLFFNQFRLVSRYATRARILHQTMDNSHDTRSI